MTQRNDGSLPESARQGLEFAKKAQVLDLIDYRGPDPMRYPGATQFAAKWFVPRAEALALAEANRVPVAQCLYCGGLFPDCMDDFAVAGPWQAARAPRALVCYSCADLEGVISCSGCGVLLAHVELEDVSLLCSRCRIHSGESAKQGLAD